MGEVTCSMDIEFRFFGGNPGPSGWTDVQWPMFAFMVMAWKDRGSDRGWSQRFPHTAIIGNTTGDYAGLALLDITGVSGDGRARSRC